MEEGKEVRLQALENLVSSCWQKRQFWRVDRQSRTGLIVLNCMCDSAICSALQLQMSPHSCKMPVFLHFCSVLWPCLFEFVLLCMFMCLYLWFWFRFSKTCRLQLRRPVISLMYCCVYAAYCPSYKFRCRMGLCLRGGVYCNGTAECPDGSDEPPNCRSEFLSPRNTIISKRELTFTFAIMLSSVVCRLSVVVCL